MDLRKITNHPYLIKYPLTEDGIFYKIDEGKFITISRIFFFPITKFGPFIAEIMDTCGKMKVLDQMLTELLSRKHKILIFSQMTKMLDIIGDYLNYKVILLK